MQGKTAARIVFGRDGNSLAHVVDGFSAPEDGFTWSLGAGSRVAFDLPPFDQAAADLMLELDLNPFVVPVRRPSQQLVASVNGQVVGQDSLMGQGTVGYRIPARALRPDGRMEVRLEHEQACSPASLGLGDDGRALGFMLHSLVVRRLPPAPAASVTVLPPIAVPLPRDQMGQAITAATGLDPRHLVMCFESLGHNCEFGLVQRHLGAEPLGLLRFAGITLPHLLSGLERGFAGVGEEVVVRTHPTSSGKQEFLVYDDRYHIGLHTFRTTDETTAEAVRAEHGQRLRFMHRQFKRWLRDGTRLFVFQRPGQITPSQARPLLARLQDFGPNALLYVDQSPGLPAGAVEQLGHGLFHATLDRMADAGDIGQGADLAVWLSICVNAWRLWIAGRAA